MGSMKLLSTGIPVALITLSLNGAAPTLASDPPANSTCWMISESGQVINLEGLVCSGGSTLGTANGSTSATTVPLSTAIFAGTEIPEGPWAEALRLLQSGRVSTATPPPPDRGVVSSGGGSGSSSGSSGSGRCNVPSDIAADGSRCGGRAASERPGGR
jgi:hypothetical protein